MRAIIGLAILAVSVGASADQWTTVKQDLSAKNLNSEISYPIFNKTSVVAAYDKVNEAIKNEIISVGCDKDEAAQAEYEWDYYSDARVIAVNANYVGIEFSGESSCGGAHPNYFNYFMTIDSKTGAVSNVDLEVPGLASKYNSLDKPVKPVNPTAPTTTDAAALQAYEKAKLEYAAKLADYTEAQLAYDKAEKEQAEADILNEKTRLAVAELIYGEMKKSKNYEEEYGDCYSGSKEEVLRALTDFYPYVAGLAAKKTVVLLVSVPHVATPCGFSVRVPAAAAKDLISKEGQWAAWLK